MSEEWDYQVRVKLAEAAAHLAREDLQAPLLQPLAEIVARHKAKLVSQFDAFAQYVAEAEKNGTQDYPLYKWTKATIEDLEKQAKHLKSFTFYVDGEEVYAKEKADALEAELQELVGGGLVEQVNKYDTNPANNPQAPAHLRG
jgi:hypothetical protein